MNRFDVAQYFFTEHKLHPVFCGSRIYPPVFLEYMEYGTFNFIPWLLTEGWAIYLHMYRVKCRHMSLRGQK